MSFIEFVASLVRQNSITLPDDWAETADETILAQRVLERLNEYFFQTYEGIGTTRINDQEFQYFSEFHKYWEAHHAEILNARIDRGQARIAAQALRDAHLQCSERIF